jgi:hypothetical protein
MRVVRDLAIRIGFTVNRSQQYQATKAVSSMLGAFGRLPATIAIVGTALYRLYASIAENFTQTKHLSEMFDTTKDSIDATVKAAKELSTITDTGMVGALRKAHELILKNKEGLTDLRKIATKLDFTIGDRDNPEEILNKILQGFTKYADKTERINEIAKVFDDQTAGALSELSQRMPEFLRRQEEIKRERESQGLFEKELVAAEKYQKSVNDLSKAWSDLKDTIMIDFVPAVVLALNYVTSLIKLIHELLSTGTIEKPFTTLAKQIAPEKAEEYKGIVDKFDAAFKDALQIEYEITRGLFAIPSKIAELFSGLSLPEIPSTTPVNVTTNVTVPPGTPSQIAEEIASETNANIQIANDRYLFGLIRNQFPQNE